jgi:long-subunit fatty acid transport protein
MNYFKTSFFLFTLLIATTVFSQNSVMGIQYPLGLPSRTGTGPSLSMAGCATAIGNDFFGFTKNPANLGVMNRAVFSGLLSLKFLSLNDNFSNSQHASFEPNSFLFAFPLAKYGAIGVAFNQLSTTDLLFAKDTTLYENNKRFDATLGTVIDGGASEWQVGYGITPVKNLRVGISYERLNFKNSWVNYLKNDITLVDSLVDTTAAKFSSNGFSIGVMYSIDKFTLGISGKYYGKATAHFEKSFWGVDRHIDVTTTSNPDSTKTTTETPGEKIITTNSSDKVSLPPQLCLGASYKLSPEWLVAADVDVNFWSRYKSTEPLQFKGETKLANAFNLSFGTQYIPAPNLLTPKYYEIIQYRGGFRISRLPGADAFETALTLGTGLPLKQGGGVFDLFFEVGRRWDTRYSGLSENFFGLNIGLNGGQKWFQSTEEGY